MKVIRTELDVRNIDNVSIIFTFSLTKDHPVVT